MRIKLQKYKFSLLHGPSAFVFEKSETVFMRELTLSEN
jgi:hypothetical protein